MVVEELQGGIVDVLGAWVLGEQVRVDQEVERPQGCGDFRRGQATTLLPRGFGKDLCCSRRQNKSGSQHTGDRPCISGHSLLVRSSFRQAITYKVHTRGMKPHGLCFTLENDR